MMPDDSPAARFRDLTRAVHEHLNRMLQPLKGDDRPALIKRSLSPQAAHGLSYEVAPALEADTGRLVNVVDVQCAVESWGAQFIAIAAHLTSHEADCIRGELGHFAERAVRTAKGADAVRLALSLERWRRLTDGLTPARTDLHRRWFEGEVTPIVALTVPGTPPPRWKARMEWLYAELGTVEGAPK